MTRVLKKKTNIKIQPNSEPSPKTSLKDMILMITPSFIDFLTPHRY